MGDLTSFQRAILMATASGFGGFTVADIAFLIGRQPGHESNRAHSALVLAGCMALEKAGHLRRLDDKRPIAWCLKTQTQQKEGA